MVTAEILQRSSNTTSVSVKYSNCVIEYRIEGHSNLAVYKILHVKYTKMLFFLFLFLIELLWGGGGALDLVWSQGAKTFENFEKHFSVYSS